jgi:hypothetical protein
MNGPRSSNYSAKGELPHTILFGKLVRIQIDKYFRHAHVQNQRFRKSQKIFRRTVLSNMCFGSSGFNLTCCGSGLKHSNGHLAFLRLPSSKVAVATRAFVAVLLLLARRHSPVLEVNRDPSVEQLAKAYRKAALKAHPDKGGRKEDAQTLQAAKETWDKAREGSEAKGGRPSAGSGAGVLVCRAARPPEFQPTDCLPARLRARAPAQNGNLCLGARRRKSTKP